MHVTLQDNGSTITLQRFRHTLVAHVLGPDGYLRSDERELDELQWATLSMLVRRADFWELPGENQRSGFDGTTWVLEGIANDRYHCVSRWSPHPEADNEWFALPCYYLRDLASAFGGAFLEATVW